MTFDADRAISEASIFMPRYEGRCQMALQGLLLMAWDVIRGTSALPCLALAILGQAGGTGRALRA